MLIQKKTLSDTEQDELSVDWRNDMAYIQV